MFFGILQTSVGSENVSYYHETDEVCQPTRPTQPNKNLGLKVAFWGAHFFPTANKFSWVGVGFV